MAIASFLFRIVLTMQRTIELRSATIEQISPTITLVRIREEMKLTTAFIGEVMEYCHRITTGSCTVVVMIPEYTDYESAMMTLDHSTLFGFADHVNALVIICQEYGLLHLIHLYFAYFPPTFEVKFCDNLTDAGVWIAAQEVSRTAA